MTEDELRRIMAEVLNVPPDSITDSTSTETVKGYDSHSVMMLTLAIEEKVDYQLSDDEVSQLTSWPNIKAVMAAHETGTDAPFYKALVLDADGTLWQGIAAEGGAFLSDPFLEAQQEYGILRQRGVLLAIVTKNDLGEVEAVLRAGSPEMYLGPEDFTVIQAGWGNKADRITEIAKRLNIGLDAVVFVDDSSFECEYVRAQLPMVKVVQVPADISEYPRVAQEIAALFPTMVDTSKTAEYRSLAAAEATRPQFASEDEYLASLGMKITLRCNEADEIPRISELTMKANQFNLTTRRYTEEQIRDWMMRGYVYSIRVEDKFGDQGIVGVVIIDSGRVDTFLLSCRILGRGVEHKLWGPIVETMRDIGWKWMIGSYIPTGKNEQVRDFWKSLGFEPRIGGDWAHSLDTLQIPCPTYMEVHLA